MLVKIISGMCPGNLKCFWERYCRWGERECHYQEKIYKNPRKAIEKHPSAT